MGSKNTDRQTILGFDTDSLPTLAQVLDIARSHTPGVGDVEALRKYYKDHIGMAKKTNSIELWHRIRMAEQLIPIVSHIQSDFYKNLYIMN